MIRIDLLKGLDSDEEVGIEELVPSAKKKSKKTMFIALGIAFLIAIGGWFAWPELQARFFAPKAKPVQVATHKVQLKEPKKPNKAVAVPKGKVVEEALPGNLVPKPVKQKRAKAYQSLLPTDRLQYQKAAMFALLNRFHSMTPKQVGFKDMVLRVPGYYYVNGLSSDSTVLQSFSRQLKQASTSYHTLKPKDVAKLSSVRSFTAYGNMNLALHIPAESSPLVHNSDASKVWKDLKVLAKKSGIDLRQLKQQSSSKYGLYQRIVYRSQIDSDYQGLLDFLQTLQQNSLKVGILQVAIRASAREFMSSTVDFVLYTES